MSTAALVPIEKDAGDVLGIMLDSSPQVVTNQGSESTVSSPQQNHDIQLRLTQIKQKCVVVSRQPEIQEQPQLTQEALSINNLAEALSYAWFLRWPELADPIELEQAIRFVVEIYVEDPRIINAFEALCWRHPRWLLFFPESLGRELLMMKALGKIREGAFLSRPSGVRGSVAKSATMLADKKELIDKIKGWYDDAPDETRREIALLMGEWGGAEEARLLREWLCGASTKSEYLKRGILAALANIGGLVAVDTLLEVAETAPKLTALAAIGSLESLASGGSTALTELPEPPVIENREQWNAYKDLADRLMRFSKSKTAEEFVRYKASQLLETIRPGLRKQPAA